MFAFVKMHVWNAGMEAKRVVVAAERPDVNVVDFLDAVDGENGAGDVFDAQLARAAFEKDVRGFAQDADAGPQDEQADGETEKRVDPMGAGDVNDDRANDDGNI